MSVLDKLKHNYKVAKAELTGQAISRARLIKQLNQIVDPLKVAATHAATPVPQPTGVGIRMLDGAPMMFYTDGSLRHQYGKPSKAARKKLKRGRVRRATAPTKES
jgi:hypothetical protein